MNRYSFIIVGLTIAALAGCQGFDLSSLLGGGTTLTLGPEETNGGTSSGSGPHLESAGRVVVEGEHFTRQGSDWIGFLGAAIPLNNRNWVEQAGAASGPGPDPDGFHDGASGNSYMECLPDTRVTDKDALGALLAFFDDADFGAWTEYDIDFQTTGTFIFWARCFSSGSEDNGAHVGLDGTFPASGKKLQRCNPGSWAWSSAQRGTGGSDCGLQKTITLNITTPGVHAVRFYQREDGFELDRFMMTTDQGYTPEGAGPVESPRANP